MARLAELLTGAKAPGALARRDIATVSGILRDAGASQVHILRATGAVMDRGWGGSAAGLDGPGVCPWPAAGAGDDAATEDDRRRKPTAPRCHRAVGFAVFGAADPIRIHHTPTPVQSRMSREPQTAKWCENDSAWALARLGLTQLVHAEAAAAHHDSACCDLAHELATLRCAA